MRVFANRLWSDDVLAFGELNARATTRRRRVLAAALACAALAGAAGAESATAAPVAPVHEVWVIVLENKEFA